MRATSVELNKIAKHLSPTDRAIVEDAARRIADVTKPDNIEAREEVARLYQEWMAAEEALANVTDKTPPDECEALQEACDKAENAYADHPVQLYENYSNADEIVRCGLSNVPVLADDEIVEDPGTGEIFLRSALGLPPRAKVEEEAA